MAEPDDIVEARRPGRRSPRPRDLAGRRILVTAGGTREPLDPVRFIGNRSSGRQGVAIARAAAARGAEVVLIAANLEVDAPRGRRRCAQVGTDARAAGGDAARGAGPPTS